MATPRLFSTTKLDESLLSEMRSFEEENIPAENRIVLRVRKDSELPALGEIIPKLYEEVDIPEL